jgi:thiamine pyrophosphokinase
MGKHAEFEVLEATPEYIYIQDTGHRATVSVTNDAEWVLQKLGLEYGLKNRRVFYVDSLGDTDEIVHENCRFIRFKFGHEGVLL